ncbi:MAG TPA: ABC transporter ATP-binding protein [Burkholderiales bacterium]|nr:ABC transporter ATP-binding protein [Burkholderiales bacterium]
MALRPGAEDVVMLQVRDLAFGFPGRTVGRDVSFTLAAGEVMCVLGPNGGGKTTLFRTVLGLIEKHSGSIELEANPLESLSRAEIARRIGYVPQGHSAYFAFTVREFVLMGRTAHLGAFASPAQNDLRVAERALESLGIAQLADKPVTEISGGERQLALVARALAQEPRLLVLDEPTASLDFGNQVRVLQKVEALARSGIAVLFSSHDPDHAFLCAGRALLLAEGRVLEIGTPREVIRADTLERMYRVSVQVVPLPGGMHTCLPGMGP